MKCGHFQLKTLPFLLFFVLICSIMAMCKQCGIEKLSNEFPPVTVSDECDHPPLACLRVSKQTF